MFLLHCMYHVCYISEDYHCASVSHLFGSSVLEHLIVRVASSQCRPHRSTLYRNTRCEVDEFAMLVVGTMSSIAYVMHHSVMFSLTVPPLGCTEGICPK